MIERTQTGLIQEALLILAGHRSGILIEREEGDLGGLKESISHYFHPASIECLNNLIRISNDYNRLDTFSRNILKRFDSSSHPLIFENKNDCEDNETNAIGGIEDRPLTQSISAFASGLSIELDKYRNLLVEIEFKLLSHHPSFVPIDSNQVPSPPLTAILAELTNWSTIFKPLQDLIDDLIILDHEPSSGLGSNGDHHIDRWTSSRLIELIYQHSLTGSPHLAEILDRLQYAVERVWINSFRSFVIYGQPPNLQSNKQSKPHHHPNSLSDDLFIAQRIHPNSFNRLRPLPGNSSHHHHQPINFYFRKDALPHLPSLEPIDGLTDSIHQITHAFSILNHLIYPAPHSQHDPSNYSRSKNPQTFTVLQRINLPLDLQSQLRLAFSSIDRLSHPQFRTAIKNIQEILSNYLFSTYLTPEILSTTLQSLTDVFLLRHSTFAANLVEGFIRLRLNRLGSIMSDEHAPSDLPHRSGGGRRAIGLSDRELDVILLKAGISTELGDQSTGRKIDLEGFSFTSLPTPQTSDKQDLQGRTGLNDHDSNDNQRSLENQALIDQTFANLILNDAYPILLTYSPRPGLSLFLTNQICDSYSKINSCLMSFLITKQRFKNCWRDLMRKERLNTRLNPLTGPNDGGDNNIGNNRRSVQINEFKRLAFENLRRMNWFIDLIVNYFFQDVIDQSISLLFEQLDHNCDHPNSERNPEERLPNHGAEDRGKARSNPNFFKIHRTFLRLIEIGLGFKNPMTQTLIKQILKGCVEFLTEIENWCFELVPNLLSSLNRTNHKEDDEDSIQEHDDDDKIIKMVQGRKSKLIKSMDHFHQLVSRLIVELRKDELQCTTHAALPGPIPPFQSYVNDDYHHHPAQDSDSSLFFLKASIFRRKCLDSLLLQFNFNHWFSSSPTITTTTTTNIATTDLC